MQIKKRKIGKSVHNQLNEIKDFCEKFKKHRWFDKDYMVDYDAKIGYYKSYVLDIMKYENLSLEENKILIDCFEYFVRNTIDEFDNCTKISVDEHFVDPLFYFFKKVYISCDIELLNKILYSTSWIQGCWLSKIRGLIGDHVVNLKDLDLINIIFDIILHKNDLKTIILAFQNLCNFVIYKPEHLTFFINYLKKNYCNIIKIIKNTKDEQIQKGSCHILIKIFSILKKNRKKIIECEMKETAIICFDILKQLCFIKNDKMLYFSKKLLDFMYSSELTDDKVLDIEILFIYLKNYSFDRRIINVIIELLSCYSFEENLKEKIYKKKFMLLDFAKNFTCFAFHAKTILKNVQKNV